MSWEKTVRPWFTSGSWLGSQARIAHPEPGFKSRTGRQPHNTLDDLNLHDRTQELTGHYCAELVVTEFMDFTCPYAVKWSFVSDSLNALYGDRIRIVFHHFPLQNRGHSQTAAIAVECALEQGVFDRMYTSLYQYQDSIGAVGWNWFADRSAVPDLEAFEDCVRRPVEEFPRIGQGRSVGLASGVRGTPTVWLNGEPIAVPSVASFSARVKQ
jgi:protein-disulfide isomerase